MTANFLKLMTSDPSRALQSKAGSRAAYAAMEQRGDGGPDMLGAKEAAFIHKRDSFYMATVTPDGWPYVQHRGGPAGFLQCLGPRRIGFADLRGNRQYLSAGNLAASSRVALIMLDYAARRRLKLVGYARCTDAASLGDDLHRLVPYGSREQVEAVILIDVIAFDWNCPRHITQRWTLEEMALAAQGPSRQAD